MGQYFLVFSLSFSPSNTRFKKKAYVCYSLLLYSNSIGFNGVDCIYISTMLTNLSISWAVAASGICPTVPLHESFINPLIGRLSNKVIN